MCQIAVSLMHQAGIVLHYVMIVTRLGPVTQGQVTRSTSVMRLVVEPMTNHNDPSLAVEPLQEETHVVENLEEYYQYSLSVAMVNSAGEGRPTLSIILFHTKHARYKLVTIRIEVIYNSIHRAFRITY